MKKFPSTNINLCIFFEYLPIDTGNFTQSFYNLNQALKLAETNKFVVTLNPKVFKFLQSKNIDSYLVKLNLLNKIYLYILRISSSYFSRFLRKIFGLNAIEKILFKLNIDLVYFTSQSPIVEYIESFNYIYTLYDLAHIDLPEFPEFDKSVFKSRNRIFRIALKRALAVLCESEVGYEKIINEYNVSPERIYVSKLFSPLINSKYLLEDYKISKDIENPYLIYPAAFWPHKNHAYLIYALSIINKDIPNLKIKFTGIENDHSRFILNLASKLKVEHNIQLIKYQSSESLRDLICYSLALVYPSYLWPSNIPPLEALSNNCPVFVGASEESKKFLRNSVYYFDFKDPNSLAQMIINLYKNGRKDEELIASREFILNYINKQSLKSILEKILKEYSCKKINWP